MATNSTTYYNLPVFAATDQPKWLVDWNNSIEVIDGAIAQAKAAGDNAQTTANANALAISGLSDSVSTMSTALGTLTTNVTTVTGNVQRINELIGNGTPTTQDKTIIGAINELKAEIDALAPGGAVSAAEVSYDNTSSGLTADDVQEAIDEVAGDVATLDAKVGFPTRLNQGVPQYSADGGTTWANFSGALTLDEVEGNFQTVSYNTPFADETYTFNSSHAEILIIATAARTHGGNETISGTLTATSSDFTVTEFHSSTTSNVGALGLLRHVFHAENISAGDTISINFSGVTIDGGLASSMGIAEYVILTVG